VEDQRPLPYQYDEDIPIFIQDYFTRNDFSIEKGLLANPFKWSGEPEAIVLNGQSGNSSFLNASGPSCTPLLITVKPDTVYRLRFISGTALSLVTLGIEEHDNLTIIEADGQYTKPWSTDHVQLGSGQRFSVLLRTKSAAESVSASKTNFWVRYESRDRPTNVTGYALLRYDVPGAELPSSLPTKSPVTLPRNVTSWAEYSLESLEETEPFPSLSEVTRTVTITMRQVIKEGAYVNKTINGTLEWA
jgi:L-ascorbate oxidase